MDHDIAVIAPTSTAATRETEPEVVAGISSAEGSPDMPLSIHAGGSGHGYGYGRALLGIAAGLGFGYALTRWLRGSRSG